MNLKRNVAIVTNFTEFSENILTFLNKGCFEVLFIGDSTTGVRRKNSIKPLFIKVFEGLDSELVNYLSFTDTALISDGFGHRGSHSLLG